MTNPTEREIESRIDDLEPESDTPSLAAAWRGDLKPHDESLTAEERRAVEHWWGESA